MKHTDLINCSPEKVEEDLSFDELLETIFSIEKWEERHAEVIDYIYSSKTIRLLRKESNPDNFMQYFPPFLFA